ncbi:hypothetical protein IFM89_004852 [Coptis chinensis]|uniref:Tubulin binding cofactor C-like domain-containing protein n=1 Tax=Coptis chinensis TaxID=261450 RepID=A0A835LDL9_9MAGN|nr:hypothetical protein IFM89_004852 [Coptis chinensis]
MATVPQHCINDITTTDGSWKIIIRVLLENVVEEKIRVRETEGFKDKQGELLVKSFGDLEEERGGEFGLKLGRLLIIEDSNAVRFGPYLLDYDGIEKHLKECSLDEDTGNWENVDDFRWLRAVQSPNWCVLPEEECVGVVNISGLETPPVKRVGEF